LIFALCIHISIQPFFTYYPCIHLQTQQLYRCHPTLARAAEQPQPSGAQICTQTQPLQHVKQNIKNSTNTGCPNHHLFRSIVEPPSFGPILQPQPLSPTSSATPCRQLHKPCIRKPKPANKKKKKEEEEEAKRKVASSPPKRDALVAGNLFPVALS